MFRGRVALITGGGRGIGREIALAFAGLGADVIIASRNEDNLRTTAADRAIARTLISLISSVRSRFPHQKSWNEPRNS
ncbi:MAG: SDR family NAD(P)-dependent oxidoreductase [Kamptonema sp. SIO4C4]|nr:SDR family NAD(P)-dependent oxidoreductase [Kamptonema sp. SIO4C4]